MTVYNTAEKLSTKKLEVLNGLVVSIIESSYVSNVMKTNNIVNSINYGRYNTIDFVGTRTFSILNDLLIDKIEISKDNRSIKNLNSVTSREVIDFNDMDILSEKELNRMSGLLIHIIEKSKRENVTKTKAFIIKPKKEYSAKLRLLKSFSNNIKY